MRLKIRKLLFLTFSIVLISCGTQFSPTEGGVYVNEDLVDKKLSEKNIITPITALRIDKIVRDGKVTLEVKYKFGKESFMDADFTYKDSCDCYLSNSKVCLAPFGREKVEVYFNVFDSKTIILNYERNKNLYQKRYFLTYIDSIDYSTYRDPYYSEDGYSLFKDE